MEKLDGRSLSKELKQELKAKLASNPHLTPCLAVVLVGSDPASKVYVSHKIKACEEVGIKSLEKKMPETTSPEALLKLIEELNQDKGVHGILVQLPLPDPLKAWEDQILSSIDPGKDVDGLHPLNLGLLAAGRPLVTPCTPTGVMALLKKHQIPLKGKKAVVVGRSQIVGKPMALLLLQAHATVTICHSHTAELRSHLKGADIVVVAAGLPGFLGKDDFAPQTVIVDVGIHRLENGKLCGDVRFDEVLGEARALTPVPGGVGPMTIAMLLENTWKLAQTL